MDNASQLRTKRSSSCVRVFEMELIHDTDNDHSSGQLSVGI